MQSQSWPTAEPLSHLCQEGEADTLAGSLLLHSSVERVVSAVHADAHALVAGTLVGGPAALVGLEVLGADSNHGVLVITHEDLVASSLVG